MCWTCDHPDATEEDTLDVYRAIVRRRGYALCAVEAEGDLPWLVHTVGLTGEGLPELVVTGAPAEVAAALLDDVAEHCILDGVPAPGQRLVTGTGTTVELVEVHRPEAHLHVATALFARVRAVQLVWPDARGRYPWASGDRSRQPVLGPRARR